MPLADKRLRFMSTYRHWSPGDEIMGVIDEDELNFYVLGRNDEYPSGYHSNYITVPKYAAILVPITRDWEHYYGDYPGQGRGLD